MPGAQTSRGSRSRTVTVTVPGSETDTSARSTGGRASIRSRMGAVARVNTFPSGSIAAAARTSGSAIQATPSTSTVRTANASDDVAP